MKDSKEISLFIDSATKDLALGLTIGEEETYTIDLENPKAALERLPLGIKLLLEKAGVTLKDVDCYYVLLGPGSNTGIRMGLTIPRTLFAFNDKLKLFGIKTMDLFCMENKYAALSDRNGNLFFATKKEDGSVDYERIDKDKISLLDGKDPIAVEKEDVMAKKELSSHTIREINTIDLSIRYKTKFKDFSSDEENYLPEYILKI